MPRFSKALKSLEQPCVKNLRGPLRPDDSNERVAHYFDQDPAGYADAYLHPNTSSAFFFPRRQAIVMRFLQCLEGGLILDIGCGPGIYAKPCVEQGLRYYGLDISNEMISEGRRRFGNLANVDFAVGDARRLPFPSNSVDGLLCLGVLEYVSPEQESAYLNEMARVLKPGGIMIFSFLNASSPFWIWADYFFPPIKFLVKNIKAIMKNSQSASFKDCLVEELPTRKFRLGERTKLLQSAGLSVVGNIYFSLNVLPFPLDARFPRQLVRVSSKLEHLLQIPSLRWLGMGFVIVVQKSMRAGKTGT
jgi:ubiquinone/menaquinone biosynthesis C-methylase UbiE